MLPPLSRKFLVFDGHSLAFVMCDRLKARICRNGVLNMLAYVFQHCFRVWTQTTYHYHQSCGDCCHAFEMSAYRQNLCCHACLTSVFTSAF